MKKLILFTALSVLGITSFAQNYQPATIVTSDGTSIEGEIDYKNWRKNPDQVQFRKGAFTPETYTAKDLKSFVVGGDRYVSAIVDVDDRTENSAELTTDPQIKSHRDTVLLRAVITGSKSLYSYFDNLDHFYILRNDSFELLKYKKYSKASDNYYKLILYNRDFVTQLASYLEDCQSLTSRPEKARYETGFLKGVFTKYYECKSGKAEFAQTRESENLEIGVFAGVSNTRFNVNTSSDNIYMVSMSRANFSPSTNVTGGVFFDIVFPRQRGRLSLNNELAYSSYETSGTYRASSSQTNYEQRTFEIAFSYLKMNNMLRYKFLMGKSAFFVNGGLATGYLLNDKSKITLNRKIGSTETTSVEKAFKIDSRKYELGLVAGAGFRTGRVSAELRAEGSTGPLSESTTSAKVTRYYALLGYRIK